MHKVIQKTNWFFIHRRCLFVSFWQFFAEHTCCEFIRASIFQKGRNAWKQTDFNPPRWVGQNKFGGGLVWDGWAKILLNLFWHFFHHQSPKKDSVLFYVLWIPNSCHVSSRFQLKLSRPAEWRKMEAEKPSSRLGKGHLCRRCTLRKLLFGCALFEW